MGDDAAVILETLTSPVVLFFVLGFAAALVRSDLSVPDAFARALSIYLMAAIGLKGGVEVASTGVDGLLLLAAGTGLALSFGLPLIVFPVLRSVGRLGPADAGSVAAHYGSVSVVTFVTAVSLLTSDGIPPAGFMVGVMALMETPAIVTGLLLARRGMATGGTKGGGLAHEVLTNGSVVLLVGAFVIGLVIGEDGFAPVQPLFESGFKGALCLFLLDMGLLAARRLMETRSLTVRLGVLAIAFPLVNGTIGTLVGTAIGLDVGSAAVLGVLAASASYIAVPAAMRLGLPEADPGLSLSMSLGLTFPFNIVVGIPLFAALARALG